MHSCRRNFIIDIGLISYFSHLKFGWNFDQSLLYLLCSGLVCRIMNIYFIGYSYHIPSSNNSYGLIQYLVVAIDKSFVDEEKFAMLISNMCSFNLTIDNSLADKIFFVSFNTHWWYLLLTIDNSLVDEEKLVSCNAY